MAELVKMPFEVWNRVCPRKRMLEVGAHWHSLANMSMCGGDAAFLSNYFDCLLLLCGLAV